MQEPVHRVRISGLTLAASAVLAGIGISYLVNALVWYIIDVYSVPEDIPGIYLTLLVTVVPFFVFGAVAMILMSREAPSDRFEFFSRFVPCFAAPFFLAYLGTYFFYWLSRI